MACHESAGGEAAMTCAARLGLGLALRAGGDPAPYLDAHAAAARESGVPGEEAAPRLAWIGAAAEIAHALGRRAVGSAELEGWVEARGPADLEAAAQLAARFG